MLHTKYEHITGNTDINNIKHTDLQNTRNKLLNLEHLVSER